MPSIRRNLSPVPRPGSRSSGEAVGSVASPLSRSSSAAQIPSAAAGGGGFQSTPPSLLELGLYKIHTFISAFLYRRSSRSLDRSKWKGLSWGRALIHFSICFMVGAFMGLTPYVSIGLPMDVSNHRTLFFEPPPSVSNHQYATMENSNPVLESIPKTSAPLTHNDFARNASSQQNITQSEVLGGLPDLESTSKLLVQEQGMEIRKLVIVVTSTYTWPFQASGLHRLAQTLKLARAPLLWIVVEMDSQSAETSEILRTSGVMYRHLVCKSNVTDMRDKNIEQRNVALEHIEIHRLDGIVYFADGSNIYSGDLFEQLRQVRRFGVWRVAKPLVSQRMVILRGPVCNGTEVIGWNTNRNRLNRRFYADFSGFAFNSTILWDPKRWHRPTVEPIRQLPNIKEEFQASAFMEQIVEEESQMEVLPSNCSSVLVWNLPLETFVPRYSYQWFISGNLDSNTPL